ncbi:MAG: hypothetical protein GIX01_00225 [Candidatus Eremiobacteraeota bacterium]|nr:hypothetical protein [Candidatus Eremiobacteraeota bacterium]
MSLGRADPDVPPAHISAAVSACRRGGIYARYHEQPAGKNAIISLAPATTEAWNDMMKGVTAVQKDGLGAMPSNGVI